VEKAGELIPQQRVWSCGARNALLPEFSPLR
jgi:hypothetical protein